MRRLGINCRGTLILIMTLAGCGSIEHLPQSVGEVEFSKPDPLAGSAGVDFSETGPLEKAEPRDPEIQAEIELSDKAELSGGLFKLEGDLSIPLIPIEMAFRAAHGGLLHADFEIVRLDREQYIVFAERNLELAWDNLEPYPEAVGIYINQTDTLTQIKIIHTGANTSYSGLVVMKIFDGIKAFIHAELQQGVDPNTSE